MNGLDMSHASLHLAPAAKLALHPQFAQVVNGDAVVPINLEVSPSGLCQASCAFCGYSSGAIGDHTPTFLDEDVLAQLLQDTADLGVRSISWTGGGEPTLYKSFDKAVWVARHLKLDQGLFTNALAEPRYEPHKLEWIRITVTDRPLRSDYIRMLRPAKTVGIAFNYAGPQDDARLWEVLHQAEDALVDWVQLRPALRHLGQTVNITPPAIEHPLLWVTQYKFDEASKPHGYKKCLAWRFFPFVWEDGEVTVCGYMKKEKGYSLGNLYKERLPEILRKAPVSVPISERCQVCCKPHEANKAVHAARQLEDRSFP